MYVSIEQSKCVLTDPTLPVPTATCTSVHVTRSLRLGLLSLCALALLVQHGLQVLEAAFDHLGVPAAALQLLLLARLGGRICVWAAG
eukprot:2449520-Prymnesium_polylepis.1